MADMAAVMKLLQFTDSTFPVGTFSFSNGLETASFENVVTDARTLEEFTEAQVLQAAFSDGVAALHAHRAYLGADLEAIVKADKAIMCFKMNDEARQMLGRMGKKLAELAVKLFPDDPTVAAWLSLIKEGKTPGAYPVAQGLVFAAAGIDEKDLYCSHQYGVANMVLGAALRCVRVSHYDTQKILFRLASEAESHYEEAAVMTLDDMHAFVPGLDILASLHEKGNMRMFMS